MDALYHPHLSVVFDPEGHFPRRSAYNKGIPSAVDVVIMRKVAFLLLLLAGCGGTPDPLELVEPTANCLGPFYVKNGVGHLDGKKLRHNEAILKYLFTHPWSYVDDKGNWYVSPPLMGSNKEFCTSFGGVHTTYEWTYHFSCSSSPTGECWGLDDVHGIFLEYSANSFAHELLHVYEWQRGVFNTGNHDHWSEKGYYFLNDTLWDAQRDSSAMTGPNGETTPPGSPF